MKTIIVIGQCQKIYDLTPYPYCFHFKGFLGKTKITQVMGALPSEDAAHEDFTIQTGESYLMYVKPVRIDPQRRLLCQILSSRRLSDLEWEL